MKGKVNCTCGHSWNKSDSSKKDVNVCHVCGKDNTMKNGGWLDNYGKADNANESNVSMSDNFVGLAYDTSGRNYSPAWGGQFQTGGQIPQAQDGITFRDINDNPFVQAAKIFDPTGVSSYPDVYFAGEDLYKDPSWANAGNLGLNIFGALPMIGKLATPAKLAKVAAKTTSKATGISKGVNSVIDTAPELIPFLRKPTESVQNFTSKYITSPLSNIKSGGRSYKVDQINNVNNKVDRVNLANNLSDLYSVAESIPRKSEQYATGGSIPGTVGFTYARTGDIPSNGKYAKKTMASAQVGKTVSTFSPEYKQLYENRQIGKWLDDQTFDSQVPLDEVTVRPESYSMDSLRDFTSAALYGVPENLMKLEQVPTAALAETVQMLRGEPYDFENINPNFGYWGSNQRDLSVLGYENPEGFMQNAVNMGLSMIDPAMITGLARNPVKNLTRTFTNNLSHESRQLLKKGVFPFTYDADVVKNIPENIRRVNKGLAKKIPEKFAKAVEDRPDDFVLNMIKNREDALGTYLGLQKGGKNIKYSGVDDVTGFDKYKLSSHTPLDHSEAYFLSNYLRNNLRKIERNKSIVQKDNIFDLMGGYSQFLSPDEKSIMYRDVWDLQPLKNVKEYKGVKLPKFIRNSEVSDFIPGAKPFVSEGVLGDIKTRYAQYPYKSISKKIEDQLQNYPIDALDFDDVENYKKLRSSAINDLKNQIIQNRRPITGFERPGYYPSERKVVDIAPYFKVSKKEHGGVIKDNRGQWDHPGEITEIDSNYITMRPDPITGKEIDYKVLAVSNTGDTKLMEPGKDYKFKGKKVTEYPLMQKGGRVGINDLDAQPKKKLNQLTNFTNNPDKNNWLDKYK
jgi:hypothetical protein